MHRAWSMYDWANSAYNLVITSTIFPAYYIAITSQGNSDKVSFFGWEVINSSLLNYALALAYLIIAFLSPVLSAIADYKGNKKRFMQLFCTLGAAACCGLFFFRAGNVELGIVLSIIAAVGYCGSLVFYNAYLPEIATVNEQDKVSAQGFAYGYIGSVLLQVICLVFVFTIPDGDIAPRISFLLVGLWWFGFAQITFRTLPDRSVINIGNVPSYLVFLKSKGYELSITDEMKFKHTGLSGSEVQAALKEIYTQSNVEEENSIKLEDEFNTTTDIDSKSRSGILSSGFHELKKVAQQIKTLPLLKTFLAAFFFYSMGVQTVMLAAAEFGKKEIYKIKDGVKIPMETADLIITILLIQIVAIGGAMLMARLSKAIGNIKVLMITVLLWIAICITAYYTRTATQFYLLAVMVGLVMGGIQSISRSTYSKLMPETKDTASFFSFYDVTEKVAIVIGMFSFGFIEHITGNMRNSIFALTVFFVVGFVFLIWANSKGKQLNSEVRI